MPAKDKPIVKKVNMKPQKPVLLYNISNVKKKSTHGPGGIGRGPGTKPRKKRVKKKYEIELPLTSSEITIIEDPVKEAKRLQSMFSKIKAKMKEADKLYSEAVDEDFANKVVCKIYCGKQRSPSAYYTPNNKTFSITKSASDSFVQGLPLEAITGYTKHPADIVKRERPFANVDNTRLNITDPSQAGQVPSGLVAHATEEEGMEIAVEDDVIANVQRTGDKRTININTGPSKEFDNAYRDEKPSKGFYGLFAQPKSIADLRVQKAAYVHTLDTKTNVVSYSKVEDNNATDPTTIGKYLRDKDEDGTKNFQLAIYDIDKFGTAVPKKVRVEATEIIFKREVDKNAPNKKGAYAKYVRNVPEDEDPEKMPVHSEGTLTIYNKKLSRSEKTGLTKIFGNINFGNAPQPNVRLNVPADDETLGGDMDLERDEVSSVPSRNVQQQNLPNPPTPGTLQRGLFNLKHVPTPERGGKEIPLVMKDFPGNARQRTLEEKKEYLRQQQKLIEAEEKAAEEERKKLGQTKKTNG